MSSTIASETNTANNTANTNVNTTVTTTVDLGGYVPEDNDFADLDLNHSSIGDMVMMQAGGDATYAYAYDPGNDMSFTDVMNASVGQLLSHMAMSKLQ